MAGGKKLLKTGLEVLLGTAAGFGGGSIAAAAMSTKDDKQPDKDALILKDGVMPAGAAGGVAALGLFVMKKKAAFGAGIVAGAGVASGLALAKLDRAKRRQTAAKSGKEMTKSFIDTVTQPFLDGDEGMIPVPAEVVGYLNQLGARAQALQGGAMNPMAGDAMNPMAGDDVYSLGDRQAPVAPGGRGVYQLPAGIN